MRFPYLKQPKSGEYDPMLTMSVLAVTAAILKFILEGVTFVFSGHKISFGHVDSLTYGALLTPILGAHGYMATKYSSKQKESANVQEK